MPRRKPTSTKQKKADLKLKRAVKRGDIEAPTPAEQGSKRKHGRRTGGVQPGDTSKVRSAQLESTFAKLDKDWLEHARSVASTTALPRPIPIESTILDTSKLSGDRIQVDGLTAPKRPKWKYEQSKKEVEKNEEGIFRTWLKDADTLVEQWQAVQPEEASGDSKQGIKQFKRSPTYFERNLEVWRQLWRVTEISQILLVLLDSRAPSLHFPPSLQKYLQGIYPSRPLIFVLTKVDLVGPERTSAWVTYLAAKNPGARIVQVESYKEREVLNDGRGNKRYVDPYIPSEFLQGLVTALKEAHTELVNPPKAIAEDSEKLKHWKPRARTNVNWDALLNMSGSPDNLPNIHSRPTDTEHEDQEVDMRYLTVGLIGQPNVGKSSLLNALFGTQRVRASKTPGKTKHFQTLFWTPEIRLVDCPGLVFPNFVPMEMQILAGILPISQMPSMASCVQFAAKCMPLEVIFRLDHPETAITEIEDKRTWRAGMEQSTQKPSSLIWTAMDVMTAYATQKGWLTAKAGRPDVNRAGNAILRTCADGRSVQWGFWPPEYHEDALDTATDDGIWIRSHRDISEEWESGGSEDESIHNSDHDDDDERGTESGPSVESSDEDPVMVAGGRFGALALMDDGN